jgi:ferrous iron transport protein B
MAMDKVILIGSPNSGKSLLFNRLTGLQQKVANFPGITVDVGTGALQGMPDTELIDFPGTYSLQAISAEERALDDPAVRHVLCVIDATRLEKSLYFTLQVIRDCERHSKRVTVLANMIDVLDKHGLDFDVEGLSEALHSPAHPGAARIRPLRQEPGCHHPAAAGKPGGGGRGAQGPPAGYAG